MSRTRQAPEANARAALHYPMKRSANFQKGRNAKRAKTVAPAAGFAQNRAVIGRTFQPEMKSLDTVLNSAITSGTGAGGHVLLCNNPLLGTDRFQRIGRRIQIKAIHLNLSLHPVTPVATSVPEDLVFMLVWDRDSGGTPTLSNLLQDTDNLGAVVNSVRSNRNVDLAKRYKMLWKKNIPLRICGTMTGALPCNGAAFQANQDDLMMEFHKECDLITQFNAGNTGGIGDIENGALIFCWWTDLGIGLPTSSFDVNIRIRYYD